MARKGSIFYLEDLVQGHWSSLQRERTIRQVAESDGENVTVWVEQEPGSGGKESAKATVRNLVGFDVRTEPVTGSKIDRARPMSAQAEAGNIKLVEAPWNESFLRQSHRFEPGAKMIDAVDAAAGAFNKLASTTPARERAYAFEESGGFVL